MGTKLNGTTLAKSVDNTLSRAFAKHPLSEENRREWERAIMLIRHTLDTMERVHKVTVPRQPTDGSAVRATPHPNSPLVWEGNK